MTIKELAYSAQQRLQSSTGACFKRAHIYELLASSFGFASYAALSADAVFADQQKFVVPDSIGELRIRNRCVELGYEPESAKAASAALPAYLKENNIGVIKIADLVSHLRSVSGRQDQYPDSDEDQDDFFSDSWLSFDSRDSQILLESLDAVAVKGNALAHYALALIHDYGETPVGSEYWYTRAREGRTLTGVEKEWTDAHAAHLAATEKYSHHLHEAARLGNLHALFELAYRFDDPLLFEHSRDIDGIDPLAIAEIAERMGRTEDVKHWLTVAAEGGDTEAMRQLIEDYDRGDLKRCWMWVYLAELLGTDLTRDEYRAIHEDGSPYVDDVGGPIYADGRDGVKLDTISIDQANMAREAARVLFEQIQRTR